MEYPGHRSNPEIYKENLGWFNLSNWKKTIYIPGCYSAKFKASLLYK